MENLKSFTRIYLSRNLVLFIYQQQRLKTNLVGVDSDETHR